MRLTIFAAGSRGDIQPCAVLGRGLQRAGFEVLLAAPENFAGFAEEQGLCFHPLHGDIQEIMAGETGRRFMERGSGSLLQSIRSMRAMLGPVALRMAEDLFEACKHTDALVSLAVFAPLAKTISEVRQIPLILVEPTPLFPTGAFPAPGWPVQKNLGGLLNRFSGVAMLRVLWEWYRPFVNEFRQGLGLRPYAASSFRQVLSSTPLLGAYSERVVPRPHDWPGNIQLTGYWFPDSEADWQPGEALAAFLGSGDAPVYIGFGSMAGRHPEQMADTVLKALEMTGRRGVLLTGWGGLRAASIPDSAFVLDAAPHPWLFPRMAAVVHHGGAGTTAEGLRAGIPSVILPFSFDQAFWGKRVHELGVGPEPVPQKNLAAGELARAIQQAVTQPEMNRRARQLGESLRAEDGVGRAVRAIQQILGR